MKPRLGYGKVAPGVREAMLGLEKYVESSGLESGLLNLIKIHASQINRCAWCLDMHTKDARAAGETEQRIYALSAWRETPFHTSKERAALGWTEAVTLVATSGVPVCLAGDADSGEAGLRIPSSGATGNQRRQVSP